MIRSIPIAVKRFRVDDDRLLAIRKNQLQFVWQAAKQRTVQEAEEQYYKAGAPLGSAWAGGRIDYIAFTEAMYHDQESGKITFADGAPVTNMTEWPSRWTGSSQKSAFMPVDASRLWVQIKDVVAIAIGDITPRLVTQLGYGSWPELKAEVRDAEVLWIYELGERMYR